MTAPITHAMILAAGLGSRLAPLTDTIPKPLVPVGGRALIDRQIDHLVAAGVARIVINLHYKADLLQAHLEKHPEAHRFHIIVEETRLETGGGVLNALPFLGRAPFYLMNADGLWEEPKEGGPFLEQMHQAWDPARMDMLFMVVPKVRAHGYDGVGDFGGTPDERRPTGVFPLTLQSAQKPYIHACTRITSAAFFERYPEAIGGDKAFSLVRLYRASEAAGGRLYGIEFPETWYHISTVAGLLEAEQLLHTGGAG